MKWRVWHASGSSITSHRRRHELRQRNDEIGLHSSHHAPCDFNPLLLGQMVDARFLSQQRWEIAPMLREPGFRALSQRTANPPTFSAVPSSIGRVCHQKVSCQEPYFV